MSAAPINPDWDSVPWWRALTEQVVLLQRCTACQTYRWPPREICNSCFSFAADWVWDLGRGSVVSWVVTERPFAPGPAVPYTTVLVRLDAQEDLMLPGTLRGDPTALRPGAIVVPDFDPHPTDPALTAIDGDPLPATLLSWRLL
ncbi:Zn-ribbon domain-containing OB-fold protein [Nocardioides sp. Bht2]|uniref:Zn-ribbon domain-containing OB-fold protein n=1 Tax=Nocardioides sp. Bht2 TaxID=3392297 RepID=UPI0039B38ABE